MKNRNPDEFFIIKKLREFVVKRGEEFLDERWGLPLAVYLDHSE